MSIIMTSVMIPLYDMAERLKIRIYTYFGVRGYLLWGKREGRRQEGDGRSRRRKLKSRKQKKQEDGLICLPGALATYFQLDLRSFSTFYFVLSISSWLGKA